MNKLWYHDILVKHAMPAMEALIHSDHKRRNWRKRPFYYQHDGATPHTASKNRKFLRKKQEEWNGKLKVLEWPSNSPDMSPIENVWSYLKQKLEDFPTRPRNLDELWERIQSQWQQLPAEYLQSVALSMPNRVAEVIKKEGWGIKY
jgi:hypothetical protein